MPTDGSNSEGPRGLFQSIRPLNRKVAMRDALAGLQLAALNIPQALGYARIAGMPVITGLYTLVLPPVAFAALGSSRYLVVAADSATAAILFSGLSPLAAIATPRYVELASIVALMTAGLLLLARLLKLGFLADFLSQTVLVGFLAGVGLQVAITVLDDMFGIQTQSRRAIRQLAEMASHASQLHWPTLLLSGIIVAGILLLQRVAPKFPAALFAVVLAMLASKVWNFSERGIAVSGPIVGGLPHLGLTMPAWKDFEALVPIAFSCFVMIVTQSAATGRFYAARHHRLLNENSDLLGLSAANAAAGLSGAWVVNGSPTQTAMVERFGGTSQLAQISTAGIVALVLLFATQPLQLLPRCVLASIVFVIAVRLIDFGKLARIRRESPGEYALAMITAAVVVLVGVEQGIILAMVLSLLRIVDHSYRPHTGVLLADGDLYWRLVPAGAGAITQPGLVIYRFGAPLFYANAGHFADEIRTVLGSERTRVRWLLVDAEAITNLDYTAARVVRELAQELAQTGVRLAFARVSPYLKADFDRHHLTEVVGAELLFPRLHDALAAFEKTGKSSVTKYDA